MTNIVIALVFLLGIIPAPLKPNYNIQEQTYKVLCDKGYNVNLTYPDGHGKGCGWLNVSGDKLIYYEVKP